MSACPTPSCGKQGDTPLHTGFANDMARDDDLAYGPVRTALDGIGGHSNKTPAKVFSGQNSGHENIRHGNRLDNGQLPVQFPVHYSCGLPDQVGFCPFQLDQYSAGYPSLANHKTNTAHMRSRTLTSAGTPLADTSTAAFHPEVAS